MAKGFGLNMDLTPYQMALVIILVLNLLFWLVIIIWRFCYLRKLNAIIERRRAEMRGRINDGLENDPQENRDNLFYSLSRSDFPPSYHDAVKSHPIFPSDSGGSLSTVSNSADLEHTAVVVQVVDGNGSVMTTTTASPGSPQTQRTQYPAGTLQAQPVALPSYQEGTAPPGRPSLSRRVEQPRSSVTPAPIHGITGQRQTTQTSQQQQQPQQQSHPHTQQQQQQQQQAQQQMESDNDRPLSELTIVRRSSPTQPDDSGTESFASPQAFCARSSKCSDDGRTNKGRDECCVCNSSDDAVNAEYAVEMKDVAPRSTATATESSPSAASSNSSAGAVTCQRHHVNSKSNTGSKGDGGWSKQREGRNNVKQGDHIVEMSTTDTLPSSLLAAEATASQPATDKNNYHVNYETVIASEQGGGKTLAAIGVVGGLGKDESIRTSLASTSSSTGVRPKVSNGLKGPPPLPTSPIPDD